jgi:outer membrane lipoprotein SlyB
MKCIGFRVAVVVVAAVVFAGCASSQSGSTYSRNHARQAQSIEMGMVEAVNEAMIEGTKTPIGAAAGAVMGGVIGHSIGGGSGKDIATVAGALGGAAVGAGVEEKITKTNAWELTIKLDSGKMLIVVQGKDKKESFAVGDRVRVITAADGTVRARH